MQFTDKLQLKRKCREIEGSDDIYFGAPYNSFKRPYEIRHGTDSSNDSSLWSLGNDFIHASHKIHPSLSLSHEEEMTCVGPLLIGKANPSIKEKIFCDEKEMSQSSVHSFQGPVTSSGYPSPTIGCLSGNKSISINQSQAQKESGNGQGCPECLAGKSGHFHHIGRWRLIDSPSGFCQL